MYYIVYHVFILFPIDEASGDWTRYKVLAKDQLSPTTKLYNQVFNERIMNFSYTSKWLYSRCW